MIPRRRASKTLKATQSVIWLSVVAAHRFGRRQVEHVRAQIADLHLQGDSQRAIADRVGLRQQTVQYHLDGVCQRWRDQQIASLAHIRADQIEKCRLAQRLALEGYHASGGHRKSTTTRQRKVPLARAPRVDGGFEEEQADRVERETRVRIGERDKDPRFLFEYTAAVDLESRPWGVLEEPLKPLLPTRPSDA